MTNIQLPNGIKFASFTKESLKGLWEKIKPFDAIFVDDNMRDPEVYLNAFLDKRCVVLECDGGMLFIENIVEGLRGEAHFFFWDGHIARRKELIKQCLLWAFLTFDLERIYTYIAGYARAMKRFVVDKLDFKYEGTLRHHARHQGKLINVSIYSILKEEVLKDG